MARQGRGGGGELVVCVLNQTDALHEVLTAFVEAGVTASTVIESQGMGRILSQEMPVFAGFRQLFAGSRPFNYTIFSVVESGEVTERLIALVRDVLQDTPDEAKGIVFSVPVNAFAHLGSEEPAP